MFFFSLFSRINQLVVHSAQKGGRPLLPLRLSDPVLLHQRLNLCYYGYHMQLSFELPGGLTLPVLTDKMVFNQGPALTSGRHLTIYETILIFSLCVLGVGADVLLTFRWEGAKDVPKHSTMHR